MKKRILFITLALAFTLSLSFAAGCRIIETPQTDCKHKNYSDWDVTVAPTCTSKGTKTRTCADCGKVQTESVDEIKHLFSSDGYYCAYGCGAIDGVNNATEGVYEVYNAKGWSWVTKNADLTTCHKIVLTKDIDMANVDYTPWNIVLPEGATLEIDGQGHTIKNLTVSTAEAEAGAKYAYASLIGKVDSAHHNETEIGTLKVIGLKMNNVTVTNSTSVTISPAAALIGRQFVANVEISNCEVTNSTITGKYAAGFIGYCEQYYDYVKTEITDCTVSDCTFYGHSAAAGFVGLSNRLVTVSGGSVTNNTMNGNGGHSAAALVGTGKVMASGVTMSDNTFTKGSKFDGDDTNTYGKFYDETLGYVLGYNDYTVNEVSYPSNNID